MAQNITNLSPKVRFMQSGDSISKHRALVDSTEFQRAADFALLQYTGTLAQQTTNANESMAMGLKIQGAHEFLQTMRLLAAAPLPAKLPPAAALNHNV